MTVCEHKYWLHSKITKRHATSTSDSGSLLQFLNKHTVKACLKKVTVHLHHCRPQHPLALPFCHSLPASLCLLFPSFSFLFFFFPILWSCLNSHLALPLSSSRSSTKQGAWGVFTHFPSPLSYTLITGLELLDNAESVTFFFFNSTFWLLYLWLWQFTSFKLHLYLMTFSSK